MNTAESPAIDDLDLLKRPFTQFFDEDYDQIFSPLVTFWYMVFQRLNKDHTMSEVQQDLADGGADGLTPPGKQTPLDRHWLSASTASYSDARQRMDKAEFEEIFKTWAAMMAAQTKAAPGPCYKGIDVQEKLKGLSVQLLDGTTFRLPSLGDIAKTYPPAKNQHGESYWCQIRAVAGFCLKSGAILSVSYGDQHKSEQELCVSLFKSVEEPTLFVADANFGVYSIFERVSAHSHDVLAALTTNRAHKLLGGEALQAGEEREVLWTPSKFDKQYPGTSRNPVRVRVMCKKVIVKGEEIDLYLATTLMDSQAYSVDFLFDLYRLRWLVEVDFRYLKTQLEMNTFDVQSADMAVKEIFAGLFAYNMVQLAMWSATRKHKANTLSLSFSNCARAFLRGIRHLWNQNDCFTGLPWGKFWKKTQTVIGRMLLPRRKKARSAEPRRVRRRPALFPALKGSRQENRETLKESG